MKKSYAEAAILYCFCEPPAASTYLKLFYHTAAEFTKGFIKCPQILIKRLKTLKIVQIKDIICLVRLSRSQKKVANDKFKCYNKHAKLT